jgi:hypothetical protein
VAGLEKGSQVPTVWRVNTDGSNPEKLVDNCGAVIDVDGSLLGERPRFSVSSGKTVKLSVRPS